MGAIKPNTGFPSYIGDPLAMPTIERLTPTVPEKEATSTPQTEKSEAKTPEMKPETPPVVKSSTYIIQEGDTLGKIADKYNVSKNDLMAENDMWSGHPIYIGETLVIPPTVKEAPTTPTKELPNTPPEKPEVKPDPTKAPDTGSSIYMIQNRDTIGEISRNIKITPEEMIEASKPHAGAPLYITDPLAIPTIDKLTPKTEPEKETPSTPEKPEISAVPEMKIPETPKPAVKPEVEKPETVKGKYENPLLKSDETYGYYTWEANDTMHSLARNFFTTVDELLRLNGKAEGDIFNPGDDVIVPTSKYMVYHDLDSNLKPKVSTVPEMKITETPKPEVKPEVKKPEPPKPEEKKPETAKSQVSPGESKPNLDEIFMNAVKETI